MSKRPSETKAQLREKLAAVLRDLMVDVNGKLERAIPYDDARKMTADQVISLFNFDHGIPHAIGGEHVHWNYTARMIKEHREKTAKIDTPQIRKTVRIGKAHEEFRTKLLAKAGQASEADAPRSPSKWPSPKIKSRGFPKKQRRARFDPSLALKPKP